MLIPLLLSVAALVAGCDLLTGYDLADPEGFGSLEPIVTYTEGGASVTLDDGVIDLGRISAAGLYEGWYGGEATFSNGDGWYLRVYGATSTGVPFGPAGSIVLDRIRDGQHWTTFDTSRCIVTIDAADERGLRGSATCKGMRWSDAIGGLSTALEPGYIDGQAPFDADIVFEALPSSTTAT